MASDLRPIDYATPFPKRRRGPRFWILLVALPLAALILLGSLMLATRVLMVRAQQAQAQLATATVVARAAPLRSSPFRLSIPQRRSQPMPGSNGSVIASIGDITHGQTLLTITGSSGDPILNTISVREGDVVPFTVGGSAFEIEVIELKNFLTSEDFGVFSVRTAGAGISEQEKIQRLIDAVADAQGLVFIRNGEEHSPPEAAKHLKGKYRSSGKPEMSARQFIDELASRSSASGEAYRVKLANGREITAGEFFDECLREIEGAHIPASTGPAR